MNEQTLLLLKEEVWWNGHRTTHGTEAVTERQRASLLSNIGSYAGQGNPKGGCIGKLLSPSRRPACINLLRSQMKVAERRVCRALDQYRSTQRRSPKGPCR